jgi:hypothetical protein
MYFDSHCHLDRIDLDDFNNDFDQLLGTIEQAGVTRMLCIGVNLESFDAMHQRIAPYQQVYCSAGVHPDYADVEEPTVDLLCELATRDKVVAIGETGLDYFHQGATLDWQRKRFVKEELTQARDRTCALADGLLACWDELKLVRTARETERAAMEKKRDDIHQATLEMDFEREAHEAALRVQQDELHSLREQLQNMAIERDQALANQATESEDCGQLAFLQRSLNSERTKVERLKKANADLLRDISAGVHTSSMDTSESVVKTPSAAAGSAATLATAAVPLFTDGSFTVNAPSTLGAVPLVLSETLLTDESPVTVRTTSGALASMRLFCQMSVMELDRWESQQHHLVSPPPGLSGAQGYVGQPDLSSPTPDLNLERLSLKPSTFF